MQRVNFTSAATARAGFLFFAARLGFAKISLARNAVDSSLALRIQLRRVYTAFIREIYRIT